MQIAVDGSKVSGCTKAGFGISSNNIRISGPVENYIINGVNYPNVIYDKTKTQQSTNNRGELLGMLYAFHYLSTLNPTKVVIVSDSQYVINTLTLWYPARLSKGTSTEILNYDLISITYDKLIQMQNSGYTIEFKWQKAHIPKYKVAQMSDEERKLVRLNEDADSLAKIGPQFDKPTIMN